MLKFKRRPLSTPSIVYGSVITGAAATALVRAGDLIGIASSGTRKAEIAASEALAASASWTELGTASVPDKLRSVDVIQAIELFTTAAEAQAAAVAKAAPKIDRESRRQGLRMLLGLNNQREGGPVDGLQFQEEQRAQW